LRRRGFATFAVESFAVKLNATGRCRDERGF
jgi:hypothetical protein